MTAAPPAVTPLAGRARQLAALAAHLEAAGAGRGGLVVIEGEPGSGKSRLLAEAARMAGGSGFAVAACAAREQAGAGLADVLGPLATGDTRLLEPEDLLALEARPDQRFILLERLRASAAARARRGPVLVSLDAAQWAEPAALLTLRALTATRPPLRCLCMVALRPAPRSAELTRALAQFEGDGAMRLELPALDPAAVAELVEHSLGAPPDRPLRELVAGAGGNPGYVTELLAGLAEERGVEVRDGTARLIRPRLPERLRAAVGGHLDGLSGEARRFLSSAAVFGHAFTVRDVAALLACPGGRLLPAAQEALRAGLLVERESRLEFRHELVCAAIYEGLPEADRHARGRAAVAALHEAGAPDGETALRFAAGARPGDERAIDILWRTAEDLALRAPGAAGDVLARVVELLPDASPERGRAGALAGGMLASAGRLDAAGRLLRGLLAGRSPLEADPSLHARLAQVQLLAGEHRAAAERAAAALARPDLSGSLRAQLLATLAAASALLDEPARAERTAGAAMAEGVAAGQDGAVVSALGSLSEIELRRGRLERAREAAAEAVRRADTGALDARRLHPRLALARTLLACDRLDDAERALTAVGQEEEEYGSAWSLPHAGVLHAALLLARGRLGAAAVAAGRALAGAREMGARQVEAHAAAVLVHASTGAGTRPRSFAGGEAGRGLGDPADPRAGWALAVLADTEGDAETAGRRLADAPLTVEILAVDPLAGPRAAGIALRADDPALAAAIAAEAGRVAALNPTVPSLAGCGLHARGLVDGDTGALERAVEALRASPRPLALAGALEDLGATLGHAAHREAAIEALEEALSLYIASGATRDAVRARRALRGLGVRARYRTGAREAGDGWARLTRAERAVARLVAAGLSNRGVADRLSVSRSTVDTHLTHVFAKLGVNSRVQLTRLVAIMTPD